jgi:hypothetical protein
LTWDPNINSSIAPTFSYAAKNYIYSDFVSGDIICPFYTPEIIPDGWPQSASLYNNGLASFFYYWWITVYSDCVLPNRIYFFSCMGNNGVGWGSSVGCTDYITDYGNTFRGTPIAQNSRNLFYQEKFEINKDSSNNMKISAGTSNVNINNIESKIVPI